MLPADLRAYSPPGLHRAALRAVAAALTSHGFDVSSFRVAPGSHALRARHPAGLSIEVWVRARRDVLPVVAVAKEHMEPAAHRFVAFLWLRPQRAAAAYLIPTRRWFDDTSGMFTSRPAAWAAGGEEWAFTPDPELLEPFRFEVTMGKLLPLPG